MLLYFDIFLYSGVLRQLHLDSKLQLDLEQPQLPSLPVRNGDRKCHPKNGVHPLNQLPLNGVQPKLKIIGERQSKQPTADIDNKLMR